ncbi:MAG: Transposase [Verrucomicrobiaceae bacterium]|nr:Transposase [Verrucomicrobiaceae bacterium]
MKTHIPGDRPRLSLPAKDIATLEGLSHDGFQSARARKRAHALLLLASGTPVDSVLFRTGLTLKSLDGMLARMKSHGVHGAIFDRPHQHKVGQYDHALLADKARRVLGSRPPPGTLRWGLEALTEAIRQQLPEGAQLSREIVRQVLKKNLGIKSIRFVEPYWYQQIKKMA